MRFNDLLQTVLAGDHRDGLSAVTSWRQCVDLLAQQDRVEGSAIGLQERQALLDRLEQLRTALSETQRMATVVELGARLRSPTLVAFFANDRPSIAAAAMARARLPDATWASLLPSLTPTARGVLRGRTDMGQATINGLAAFGAADLVLTTEREDMVGQADMLLTSDMAAPLARDVYDPAVQEADGSQIRNLVDRIERFKSERRTTVHDGLAEGDPDVLPRNFGFETDTAGVILWVDQGPRAALVGLTLGETALEGGSGPDGHIAGAFVRRSGFRNGRFTITSGAMAGEWRMSASPFFDQKSGRFQGFRGQARRPYLHEVAAQTVPTPDVEIAGLTTDSLRQLVHELRTPLNAILGFAEIIEQQLFGTTTDNYRDMAGKIAIDARHLLAAFDDLDLAARVSRGERGSGPQPVDPALLVMQTAARYREQAGYGSTRIDIAMGGDLPTVRVDPVQAERMVQHLFRTLVSVAPEGEVLTGACWFQPDAGDGRVVLALDRPSSLAGLDETQLLDPAYTPDGEWADGPLLGLGFSLRLIRSLATNAGGSLTIEAGRLLLAMPAEGMEADAADLA